MPRSPTATKLATATFTAWLVTLVAIPAASEVLTLKFAGGGPATLPSIDFLRDHVGDSFRSLSGGKIEISPNLAGDLCTEYECVEAARRHSTDLAVLSCGDMGAFGITEAHTGLEADFPMHHAYPIHARKQTLPTKVKATVRKMLPCLS